MYASKQTFKYMGTKSAYSHKVSIPFSFTKLIYMIYTFKYGLEGNTKIVKLYNVLYFWLSCFIL